MRDYPPDYLKTICTIDPLGSHRLLFTIYKKMNQTLKEFYSQDASYKALSAEDQIRLLAIGRLRKKSTYNYRLREEVNLSGYAHYGCF